MKTTPKTYQARETWLADAMMMIAEHFDKKNYAIPQNVRVSCGLPSRRAFSSTKRAFGEAWSSTQSSDKHHEIFISPTIDDPKQVLATLAHELVHVTVGLKCGHRGAFIECARSVGLVGSWTSPEASDDLMQSIKRWLDTLGAYPHHALSQMTNGKKKQKTRLLKVGCPSCGYTTRITQMWILYGVPTCPNELCEQHGELFEVCWPDDEKPEEDPASPVLPE